MNKRKPDESNAEAPDYRWQGGSKRAPSSAAARAAVEAAQGQGMASSDPGLDAAASGARDWCKLAGVLSAFPDKQSTTCTYHRNTAAQLLYTATSSSYMVACPASDSSRPLLPCHCNGDHAPSKCVCSHEPYRTANTVSSFDDA
jgi:hypothetical protein